MNRRAFTLLELLIAIALLLTLGALSVPVIIGQVEAYRFESAIDLTTGQLLLARAHAQSTGRSVEVLYRSPPTRLEARYFQPGQMIEQEEYTGDESPSRSIGDEDGESDGYYSLGSEEDPDSAGAIFEGWALQTLPDEIHISDTPPNMDDEAYDLLSPSDDFEYDAWGEGFSPPVAPSSYVEEEETVSIRLAVFLPDGSALICEPAWLHDEDRRQGKLTVNPWSGLPVFERITATTDDLLDPLEEEEEEPDDLDEYDAGVDPEADLSSPDDDGS